MSDLSDYPKDELRFMIIPKTDLSHLIVLLREVRKCPLVSDWYRGAARRVLEFIDFGGYAEDV